VVAGLSWGDGVRRQGLEPRTVALRVLVRCILDLRHGLASAATWASTYRCCPWLTPGCRSFAAPARPTLGHGEGTAGEDDAAPIVAARVASSGDG